MSTEFYDATQILTPASGYLAAYDYSLNPWRGCSFGCSYCYAAAFHTPERQQTWGDWLLVKQNAVDKVRRLRRDLRGKRIYLSSATDPYLPIERRLGLVREILPILAERGAHLTVQTRSPLVTRDIDLLRRFDAVCVNMTVTTDAEAIRRIWEPTCPPIPARLAAITEIAAVGIPTAVTMTPLLPLDDPAGFAAQVSGTGAQRFVVERFQPTRGHFAAGTRPEALSQAAAHRWTDAAYESARDILAQSLPDLREGRSGFDPDWLLGLDLRTPGADAILM